MRAAGSRKERGSAIIEFGFVAFIFFLIIWAIFDFGHAFYARNSLQHLTRCTAREAVVFKPSQWVEAKKSCLMPMQSDPTKHYWPFYQLVPVDMKPFFRIRYILKNGGYVEEPNNANYDDQVAECLSGSDRCISYVQVYVPNTPTLQEYRLLRSWLGIAGAATEPVSSTMMPAESLGYVPP